MKNKICFIDNIGPHYRFPIYEELGKRLGFEFYFGDKINEPIKTFNYEMLTGFKGHLDNVYLNKFYWQRKSLRLIFKDYKYYVIIGEPYCLSSWVLLLFAKIMGKHSIAWTHGYYGREGKAKSIVKRLFYSLFDHLLVYNQHSIQLMEKDGLDKDKMVCIANSLDSNRLKAIRRCLSSTDIYKQHFHNDNAVIIYCGRIQKRKKLNLLFRAARILRQENKQINIIIVGKNVDTDDLFHNEDFLKMNDCTWLYGECYDDTKLAELFYNADICVSPGNVGLTAIHSLSFGCPVITHDNFAYQMPEYEAIRSGATGDFFKQDDATDLANKIEKWINLDANTRQKIRQTAYNDIDLKWNIDYQVSTIRKIINGK